MVDNGANIGTAVAGGAAGLTLLVWMIRKAWGQIVGTRTDTQIAAADQAKMAADQAIFVNMQSELTRIANEMKDLKATHKAERQELEHRIDELEAKILRLGAKMSSVRVHAVNVYAELTSKECHSCPPIDRAITHIKKILEDE